MHDVFEPWPHENKCMAFAGSERGLPYPHPDLTPGVDCLIAEGEMDALPSFKEVGHLVYVVTTAGASTPPGASTLAELSECPYWLIATDMDDAGDDAAERWRKRGGARCRRLQIPDAKDIGEFVEAGGNLAAWLALELRQLGFE